MGYGIWDMEGVLFPKDDYTAFASLRYLSIMRADQARKSSSFTLTAAAEQSSPLNRLGSPCHNSLFSLVQFFTIIILRPQRPPTLVWSSIGPMVNAVVRLLLPLNELIALALAQPQRIPG